MLFSQSVMSFYRYGQTVQTIKLSTIEIQSVDVPSLAYQVSCHYSQVQNGAVVNREFLLSQILVNFSFSTNTTDTCRTL